MIHKSAFGEFELAQDRRSLCRLYYEALDRHAERRLFVDVASGRTWTGAQIKAQVMPIATALIKKHKLCTGDMFAIMYDHCDYTLIMSLAVIIAGGTVCYNWGEYEHLYKCVRPKFIAISSSMTSEICKFGKQIGLVDVTIISMDINNDNNGAVIVNNPSEGDNTMTTYGELVEYKPDVSLFPVKVDNPEQAGAYILFTSGSTGLPKPVLRTHEQSAYVSHVLNGKIGQRLWHLTPASVLANQLPLDHGTGTFSLKITMQIGCTLAIMPYYEPQLMLASIESWKITDLMLASAFLHNLLIDRRLYEQKYDCSSLINIMSIGSKIVDQQTVNDFMERHPHCAIRQTYGSTECGFVALVERERCRELTNGVGKLLPNVEAKLLDTTYGAEIETFDTIGELYIRGKMVSKSYYKLPGASEQTHKPMLETDGFYRTGDLARFSPDGNLYIEGRSLERLCLYDGWKVLPQELESILVQHPDVAEACVAGAKHPDEPGNDAPRAYVTLKEKHESNVKLAQIANSIMKFYNDQVIEHKRTVGGLCILSSFPRISIGKINRKLIRQMALKELDDPTHNSEFVLHCEKYQ